MATLQLPKTLIFQPAEEEKPNPLPERAPPPFIGVLDLFPQISWREGLPHGDEGGGRVHDKGAVHGHGPWQGAASPKLEEATVQPGRWDGAAEVGCVPR